MIILLTVVWIILRESITITTVVVGLILSTLCVFLSKRIIPLERTEPVKPLRLILYLLYLLGQVYIGGIATIRIILLGSHVEIVEINTQITNKVLRTVLVNSITLVPGSVSLGLEDDKITVLWLTRNDISKAEIENAGELLKGKLERMLLKAQK